MPELYTTIKTLGYSEYEEKRSLFIGQAMRVTNEADAADFVKQVKAKYHDARHNVYAYALHSGAIKYSDDGEPQGSAGLPVLDCIRKAGVEDACVVVTRYFGGILLGTGGLLRAYTKAAVAALDSACIVTYEQYTEIKVRCSYSDYQRVVFELSRCDANVDDVEYSEDVSVRFAVRSVIAKQISERLYEMSAGKICAEIVGTRFDCN